MTHPKTDRTIQSKTLQECGTPCESPFLPPEANHIVRVLILKTRTGHWILEGSRSTSRSSNSRPAESGVGFILGHILPPEDQEAETFFFGSELLRIGPAFGPPKFKGSSLSLIHFGSSSQIILNMGRPPPPSRQGRRRLARWSESNRAKGLERRPVSVSLFYYY